MGTTRVRFFEITHDGDAREVVAAVSDLLQKSFGSSSALPSAPAAAPRIESSGPIRVADRNHDVEVKAPTTVRSRGARGVGKRDDNAEKVLAWAKVRGSPFSVKDASSSLGLSFYIVGNSVDYLIEQHKLEVARARNGQLSALFRACEDEGQAQSSAGFQDREPAPVGG